jgi:sugar phosphate isomerase/epimerase
MKLTVCNEMFEDWKIDDVLAFSKEVGYEAVEIAPFTLAETAYDVSQAERSRIRAVAAEVGIEIAGLHWLFVSPKGLHVNGPDAVIRRRTRDHLCELIHLCADLGGRNMIIGSPEQRRVEDEVGFDQAFAWAVETFKEAAELAAEKDVMLCFEPLNSNITNFMRNPTEVMDLVHAVGHPNFHMMVDVYSSSLENLDIPAEIRAHADYIHHIHTNDDNGYSPGSGGADYPAIIQALNDVEFDSYLSVEVFNFEPDPKTIAQESYDYLRSLVPA